MKRRRSITRGIFICEGISRGFLPGSLDNGVSSEIVPFGGRSWEDMPLEFGGATGHSSKMERSGWNHLHFFSENLNTEL